MDQAIMDKLKEMGFEESDGKPGLYGKKIEDGYLNWDFRKSERGRFFAVIDDEFEKDKEAKTRPEYSGLRSIQESKKDTGAQKPPKPKADATKGITIDLTIKNIPLNDVEKWLKKFQQ